MSRQRILVADNSATYRKMFTRAVAELDSDAVITCVADVDEALVKIKRHDYEIIVFDSEVSESDMLLKEITSQIPKAYVLITSRPSNAGDKICAEALAKGAADYLIKPIFSSYDENYDAVKNKLASIFTILDSKRRKPASQSGSDKIARIATVDKIRFLPEIVLIAASTGGPLALETILSKLSKNFPLPILIVQHLLLQFTETLANNLDQKSLLSVKVAENNETILAGKVYIAPGGVHMKLGADGRIRLDGSPPINGVRPAADALFESVAESFPGNGVLVVILTGMGRDGANGLKKLKEKQDCLCIAQSEETSVVYGMPRVVVESGLADKILDLDKITSEIESLSQIKSSGKGV